MAKSLRPFFTYYGGKWRLSAKYPTPSHDVIFEPFAGSAGYSLRYPDRAVILNDLDPVIAATWDYLINAPESEIEALPTYDGTWETVNDLGVPQEAKYLIGWWFNKGTIGPGTRPSRWVRDAGENTGENYWGEGVKARIVRQQEYIRHWKVQCGDYGDLPDIEATWMIDPPYQKAGVHYKKDSTSLNFADLGDWCWGRDGQVLVAENVGADWLPFASFADVKATHGQGRTGVSKEALWIKPAPLAPITIKKVAS